MRVFNADKTEELKEYDLTLGHLENDTLTTHIEAIEGVEEQGHYETIAEYPNGGKDVEWIVDIPRVEAKDAYDDVENIQLYIPYTEEELVAKCLSEQKQQLNNEITLLKKYLLETDYCVIKCIELGLSIQEEYPNEFRSRAEARDKINELESQLQSL